MSGSTLVLSEVRVRPGRRTVLQIDRLEIPAGAFVGIIGPNGAGKTTLLKVCAGLIRPRSGSVVTEGLDLTRVSAWRKCELRRHIGYIPQVAEYNADLPFTLREVVAMGRASIRPLLRALTPEDFEIVDHWIEALGLGRRRGQTFRSLSGGEQQKALIARAMAQDPRVLMLDEACANLDFHWKHEISDLVEQLYRQTQMTVLMVSHEVGVLPPACTRAILIAAGRVLADGVVGQVLSPEVLQRAYHADLTTVTLGERTHIIRAQQDTGAGGRF
ncbi:MAG: ABC transporter ATP-binding protein [Planctomycetes bacterium]|nr:ABC transporter ATP-binding protein [Planctomycetota bacterium]